MKAQIEISGVKSDFTCLYPKRVLVEIDWPHTVNYKGRAYYFDCGGNEIKTNTPSARYIAAEDEYRIWLNADGRITED